MQNKIHRQKRKSGPVLAISTEEGFPYFYAPLLKESGLVEHCFTTRLGGVSTGDFYSCNLSFTRGDEKEAVLENYKRVGRVLHCVPDRMVATRQTHTTNIRIVDESDCGKGVTTASNYEDIDGLMTNIPGIALAAFMADCVPICILDTKAKAIGIVHSGWKGTVGEISRCLLQKMKETYGTNPEDVLAVIGPSICQDCYEISEEVAMRFRNLLSDSEKELQIIREQSGYFAEGKENNLPLMPGKTAGKYQLDLWLTNFILLVRAGVPVSQIQVTDVCTCHNPNLLFSHRANGEKRGNLGAFLMLK